MHIDTFNEFLSAMFSPFWAYKRLLSFGSIDIFHHHAWSLTLASHLYHDRPSIPLSLLAGLLI